VAAGLCSSSTCTDEFQRTPVHDSTIRSNWKDLDDQFDVLQIREGGSPSSIAPTSHTCVENLNPNWGQELETCRGESDVAAPFAARLCESIWRCVMVASRFQLPGSIFQDYHKDKRIWILFSRLVQMWTAIPCWSTSPRYRFSGVWQSFKGCATILYVVLLCSRKRIETQPM